MAVTTDFQTAVADFVAFAVAQGYPSTILWTKPQDVRLWRRRFYVRAGDFDEVERQAKEICEAGIARGIGVAVEAICKSEHFTIGRVWVPEDDLDAQYRMIPKTGVKMSVAVDPHPVVLVRSAVLWWILGRIGSRSMAAWD